MDTRRTLDREEQYLSPRSDHPHDPWSGRERQVVTLPDGSTVGLIKPNGPLPVFKPITLRGSTVAELMQENE